MSTRATEGVQKKRMDGKLGGAPGYWPSRSPPSPKTCFPRRIKLDCCAVTAPISGPQPIGIQTSQPFRALHSFRRSACYPGDGLGESKRRGGLVAQGLAVCPRLRPCSIASPLALASGPIQEVGVEPRSVEVAVLRPRGFSPTPCYLVSWNGGFSGHEFGSCLLHWGGGGEEVCRP